MEVEIIGDELVVKMPIKPEVSKTGKSLVICSSHGNQPTTCIYEGKVVTVGLTAYVRRG